MMWLRFQLGLQEWHYGGRNKMEWNKGAMMQMLASWWVGPWLFRSRLPSFSLIQSRRYKRKSGGLDQDKKKKEKKRNRWRGGSKIKGLKKLTFSSSTPPKLSFFRPSPKNKRGGMYVSLWSDGGGTRVKLFRKSLGHTMLYLSLSSFLIFSFSSFFR